MIKMANGRAIGNYKRLPNRKKTLITKEFCEDFKNNLIKGAIENDKRRGYEIDYSNECYMGFYGAIESTYLFYNALKEACIKHNVVKAIYEYAQRMSWYDSDCFDDDLVLRMVELGVIPYTTDEWNNLEDCTPNDWIACQIIHRYKDKGYSVIKHETWDKDDKSGLEEIYIDSPNVEIVWAE